MTVTNDQSEFPTRSLPATLGPELLERLLDYVCGEVTGCLGAGLNASTENSRQLTAVGLAEGLDALQRELGQGPTVQACTENDAVTSPDLRTDGRWPELAAVLTTRGDIPETLSLVAVAGSWDDDGPIVLTVYLDHQPTPDDLRVVEDVEPMLAMSAALVEYCTDEVLRGAQLLKMVEHRRVIEQAKGMVMAAGHCDAGTAFRMLAASSQHFNVKLRDLAVATVEMIGDAPAEGPPENLIRGDGHPAPPSDKARCAAERMWTALGKS